MLKTSAIYIILRHSIKKKKKTNAFTRGEFRGRGTMLRVPVKRYKQGEVGKSSYITWARIFYKKMKFEGYFYS